MLSESANCANTKYKCLNRLLKNGSLDYRLYIIPVFIKKKKLDFTMNFFGHKLNNKLNI